MAIEYKNLDLFLHYKGTELLVEAYGPDGEWAQAESQFTESDIANFEKQFFPGKPIYGKKDDKEISQIGGFLGNLLLSGGVKSLYSALYKKIVIQSGSHLRLLLHFHGEAQNIAFLPWEAMLYEGQPIVFDPRQSIARTVDLPEPIPTSAVDTTPYRILWLMSQPINYPDLKLEEEAKKIETILEELVQKGLIELEICKNLTPLQLETKLRKNSYHIFYFTGNSSFDQNGNAALVLVDQEEEMALVYPQQFANIVRGSNIKTLFLNSGDGMIGRDGKPGIADIALQSGIPMVIAHNYMAMTVEGSILASAFFENVVESNSVDQALFEARRQLAQTKGCEITWMNIILGYRTNVNQLWSGEAGYKIETFIQGGELVSAARPTDAFDANQFARRLQEAQGEIKNLLANADQAEARSLIAEAEDAISNHDANIATKHLSEASEYIITKLHNQDRDRETREKKLKVAQEEQRQQTRARWTVLGVSALLLLTVAVLAILLRNTWHPDMAIAVIGIPVSVIVWSFIGGVAAMLQAFVGTRRAAEPPAVSYEWLLWRPAVGIVMGSTVYLAIAAGLVALGQGEGQPLTSNLGSSYLLWVLAFLGGFSDKFAELVFDTVVRRFTNKPEKAEKGSKEEAAGQEPTAPPSAEVEVVKEEASSQVASIPPTEEDKDAKVASEASQKKANKDRAR